MASRSRSRRSARSSSTVSPGRVAVGLAIPAVIIVVAVVVGFGDGGEDDAPSSRSASSTSTTSTTSTSTTEPREPIERTGSREVDGGAPIDVGGGPDRYRLVYWVTHADGLVNEESLVVDRPFLSETITTRDGEVVGRSRSAFGLVLEGADDSRAVAIGPALAGGDLRLAIGVDVAVSSGTLEVREQREVAGRRCQVYRAATSVITGSLEGVPTSDDHADA
ncbi:MAG TPA: hypothetical protein VEA78_04040, partial [Acidimicrobiales bacterium]|nr:hypothetical protein [Acidimicrobiales bacterium]